MELHLIFRSVIEILLVSSIRAIIRDNMIFITGMKVCISNVRVNHELDSLDLFILLAGL